MLYEVCFTAAIVHSVIVMFNHTERRAKMTDFDIHTIETAPGQSAQLLNDIATGMGFVPNIFAVIAESPQALAGFISLNTHFGASSFTDEEQQIIQLAASIENECVYCVAGHSAFADSLGVPGEGVCAVREGRAIESPRLQVLNRTVRELMSGGGQIKEGVMSDFLAAGYSNAQFLEVVLGICVKAFSNYVSNALSVPVDEAFQPYVWERPRQSQGTGPQLKSA
jgi:uncharacterized peroxidase-related enzyme